MGNSWFEEKKPIIRLLGVFSLCMLLYLVFTNLPFFKNVLYPKIIYVNAYLSSVFLNIFGYATSVQDGQIVSDSATVGIRKGCDALAPIAIFTSVLIAYPESMSIKWKGILYGVLTLLFVNIIRIISLYLINIHFPSIFDLMHLIIWQVIFIFLALALCFYWIKSFDTSVNKNEINN